MTTAQSHKSVPFAKAFEEELNASGALGAGGDAKAVAKLANKLLTKQKRFYVLAVDGGINEALYGPYSTKKERDAEGLSIHDGQDPESDATFAVDVVGTKLSVMSSDFTSTRGRGSHEDD